MKSTFFLAFVLVVLSVEVSGQTNEKPTEPLLVGPSNFKLLATNISYDGEQCSPTTRDAEIYSDLSEAIKVGDDIYYEGHRFSTPNRGDGMATENIATQTCRIYPMFGLARAAGWYKPKDDDGGGPDATNGLYRMGNSLWMGSNGIGIAIFDLKKKTWSRIDAKPSAVRGDHLGVGYADENYVFITRGEFPGASLHIYSVKKDRWLGIKAISTALVREFGYTTGMVQVGLDHRQFAKQKYLPADWTLMYPKITPINKGASYRFERDFSESKTVFEISRSTLDEIFRKNP